MLCGRERGGDSVHAGLFFLAGALLVANAAMKGRMYTRALRIILRKNPHEQTVA